MSCRTRCRGAASGIRDAPECRRCGHTRGCGSFAQSTRYLSRGVFEPARDLPFSGGTARGDSHARSCPDARPAARRAGMCRGPVGEPPHTRAAPDRRRPPRSLAAPVPRTSHGRPDLSGVWQATPAPIPELIMLVPGGQNGLGEDIPSRYFINLLADFPRGYEPLQPKAAAHAARLSLDTVQHDDVGINCLPSGLPMFVTTPTPFKIVQTPGLVVMLSESDTSFRQILHGRPVAPGRSAAVVDGVVDRTVGRRHARGRDRRLQRSRSARCDRPSPQQRAAPDRALHTARAPDKWMCSSRSTTPRRLPGRLPSRCPWA